MWRKAQPKLTEKGTLEMPAETETQLVAEWETLLKANHQMMHHHNVCPSVSINVLEADATCEQKYHQQTTVVKNLVKLKMEENEDDIEAWKWLEDLITSLGEHGMSSEESGVKNEVEVVLCIKKLPWHHSIQ
ncbi:hypothetical protein EDD16DRAFT_1527163 [Pisolithus croceorrhizus]|nr:hypothetical protein EDD16DRAFT_1527163 [Pisolithus croceorrhizus]KAI6123883.1 hypothetical protein EV401DRAFT_1886527 [Pisolithus croceorrhizus]